METVHRVAASLNLVVERRLAGGEFGAYLARTQASQSVVLKVSPEDVQSSAQTVREFVPGVVPERLLPAHVHQLMDLWRQHEGVLAKDDPAGVHWVTQMLKGLRVGSEIVDHDVLRTTGDTRVLRVLDAVVAIGEQTDPAIFRTGDIVHQDFHQANVLVRDDQVVAIFDWEGAHAGDSRVDLTCLSLSARGQAHPEALAALEAEAARHIPVELRRALHGLLALQGLNYAVHTKPWKLEHFLNKAHSLCDLS